MHGVHGVYELLEYLLTSWCLTRVSKAEVTTFLEFITLNRGSLCGHEEDTRIQRHKHELIFHSVRLTMHTLSAPTKKPKLMDKEPILSAGTWYFLRVSGLKKRWDTASTAQDDWKLWFPQQHCINYNRYIQLLQTTTTTKPTVLSFTTESESLPQDFSTI